MPSSKVSAGSAFPELSASRLDGVTEDLSRPIDGADWKMVVVYRGQHCPLCTRYLNALEGYLPRLKEIGIDVAAVSADSREQLEGHMERLEVSFPLYYGLTLEQMEALGLYISIPRSEQETDHLFAEPGLFVINAQGQVQVVDISNNPFVRPDPEAMVGGLEWIRKPDNNYPIRGTYAGD